MKEAYWPLILVLLLGVGFGGVAVFLSAVLGPKKPDPIKLSPYECGLDPIGDARMPFFVHYYIVALLFLVFDIEVVFTYPWAVYFKELGLFGFVEMAVFIGIFLAIFVYVWGRGALEWE
ncbi:MAG: NADH-quinone oxidoreductase subunit A [Aquificota bacterium]|nr:MAG: NADH-quinone oxidoreductase subunit A [Aquificota bacterium]